LIVIDRGIRAAQVEVSYSTFMSSSVAIDTPELPDLAVDVGPADRDRNPYSVTGSKPSTASSAGIPSDLLKRDWSGASPHREHRVGSSFSA